MRRGWLLAALTLSACGVPRSEKPLIAKSETPAELTAGRYEILISTTQAEMDERTAAERAKCVDLGYSETDNGVRRAVRHCPGEGEAHIAMASGGYSLTARSEEDGPQRFDFGLQRLGGTGFYMVQANEVPPEGYYYLLVRFRDGRAELFNVPCNDPEYPRRADAPPLKFKCDLTTLAAAEPEFRAEAGRIGRGENELAPAILRRVGD